MTQPTQMEERLQRLNLVLRTIRNVDKIILEERHRDQLIKRICRSLIKTRGYYNAWIALSDQSGRFSMFAEAGLGKKFLPLMKQLERQGATECSRKALAQHHAVVTNDPASSCTDCPLAKQYVGRGGITARLKHRGKVYGLLCASIPASMATEEEERSLFGGIARDIAFALHKIELEEGQERAEEALRASEDRYRALFDNASDGMMVRDLEGNIIMANSSMADFTGYTTEELMKMNIAQLLSTSEFEAAMESQRRRLEGKSGAGVHRHELQTIGKDGKERTLEVVTSLLFSGERLPIVQAIARDVTEQKRFREELRAYARRAILAQEEERKRVARELHDETAQALASLGMDIDLLYRLQSLGPPWAGTEGRDSADFSQRLKALRDRASDILQGVRSLSQALRPPMLEELGLIAALQGMADDLATQQGMNAQFEVKGTPRRLSPDTELAMFRIAQEASNNIGKHSKATESVFELEFSPGKVRLRISDNGQGFEPATVTDDSAYSGKLGLIGMRERAELIGGTLTISSKPGKGTTVVLDTQE